MSVWKSPSVCLQRVTIRLVNKRKRKAEWWLETETRDDNEGRLQERLLKSPSARRSRLGADLKDREKKEEVGSRVRLWALRLSSCNLERLTMERLEEDKDSRPFHRLMSLSVLRSSLTLSLSTVLSLRWARLQTVSFEENFVPIFYKP